MGIACFIRYQIDPFQRAALQEYAAAVAAWRKVGDHRATQAAGRHHIFADYRLRVANVLRDYGLNERIEAPVDSQLAHPSWEGST